MRAGTGPYAQRIRRWTGISRPIHETGDMDRSESKRNCANPENVLLTCREREVAALRIGGMKIRVIASRLSIAEATVKAHLKNGRHKTGGR